MDFSFTAMVMQGIFIHVLMDVWDGWLAYEEMNGMVDWLYEYVLLY